MERVVAIEEKVFAGMFRMKHLRSWAESPLPTPDFTAPPEKYRSIDSPWQS